MVQTKIMTVTLWSGKSGDRRRRIMPKSRRRRRSRRNRCRRVSRRNHRHTNKSLRRSANEFYNPFHRRSLKDRLNQCRLRRFDKNRRRHLRRQRRRLIDRGRPLSRRQSTRVRVAALPRSLNNTCRWPAKRLKITFHLS